MQLENDRNLVIKEGEKGGACVRMDTNFYRGMILSSLSDKKLIKKYTTPPLKRKY